MSRALFWLPLCAALVGCGWLGLGWRRAEERAAKSEAARVAVEAERLTLSLHVAALSDAAERVEASRDDLAGELDRFDSEDWRDVVPSVKDAADTLSGDVDDLASARVGRLRRPSRRSRSVLLRVDGARIGG